MHVRCCHCLPCPGASALPWCETASLAACRRRRLRRQPRPRERLCRDRNGRPPPRQPLGLLLRACRDRCLRRCSFRPMLPGSSGMRRQTASTASSRLRSASIWPSSAVGWSFAAHWPLDPTRLARSRCPHWYARDLPLVSTPSPRNHALLAADPLTHLTSALARLPAAR